MNQDSPFTTQRNGASFARADFYPNPDDPDGPWGPWGPVIRAIVGREMLVDSIYQRFDPLALVGLNPQPLPPKYRQTWAAARAQALINKAMVDFNAAERLGGDRAGSIQDAARSNLMTAVDDLCPPWPKWPFPWPPPWDWAHELQPEELIIAGVQFKVAAGFDSPLQNDFAAAADRLMETGMAQMG